MTDQKQAPSGIWIDLETGEFFLSCVDDHVVEYAPRDLLEAAEKRFSHEKIRADKNYSRLIKAESERDRALASVGAVIEKAANVTVEMGPRYDGRSVHYHIPENVKTHIRSLNPDATAALNEMRADAWDRGWKERGHWNSAAYTNPYRKATT